MADQSERVAERNLSLARLKGGLQPIYTTLMIAGFVLIVWKGSERVVAGVMTVGSFVAYLELFLRFVNRGHRVPQLVNSLQSGAAAYARLRPLLAPALSARDEPRMASFRAGHITGIARDTPRSARTTSGPVSVSLRGVTFRYPGGQRPALRDLGLDIPAGSLVGVTGPVGSGKSALTRAILGIYPVESGTVFIGGRPLDELSPEERRGLIGYLPQDAFLFSGSLRENLTLGQPSGSHRDAFLMDALTLAALDEDVLRFPRGLDTEIGELGIRISGGQRQRVGLARAIAAAAPCFPGLLVLDDPFSAVDVTTEARILASLKEAFGASAPPDDRVTMLVCSHRLAAFPSADLVVVLQDGRIGEMGTHSQLMAASGLYARIFRAQIDAALTHGERAGR